MHTTKQLARERVEIYRFNRLMKPFVTTWGGCATEEERAELRWFRWHRAAARAIYDFERKQGRR